MDYRGNRTSDAENLFASGLSTGPGTGARCAACEQPIESGHVECRTVDTRGSGEVRRFHQWCYYARAAK
jgi:hypothetical protein